MQRSKQQGDGLRARFERVGACDDLEKAVAASRAAVAEAGPLRIQIEQSTFTILGGALRNYSERTEGFKDVSKIRWNNFWALRPLRRTNRLAPSNYLA